MSPILNFAGWFIHINNVTFGLVNFILLNYCLLFIKTLVLGILLLILDELVIASDKKNS